MLAEVLKNPVKLLNFVRKIRVARALYDEPYRVLLARAFDLHFNQHFTPKDLFVWDLLRMDCKMEVPRRVISKADLLQIQQRLNPSAAAGLTENKGVFSCYCRARGLPAPRLLAVVGHRSGWTAEGAILLHDRQWQRFFDDLPLSEIVVKPCQGAYGRGIRFFNRQGASWTNEVGRQVTAADILRTLRQDGEFSEFVVEERVKPHPALVRLSGTGYLQTTRIATMMSGPDGPELIFAVMKLIGGDATTDNFSFGSSGNMVSKVSLETGRLEWVRTVRPHGVGLVDVTHHPATGADLRDFVLPDWKDACELARRAARQFLPLLTIGWDIAFTPTGPLLIEGNAWWDPPNQLDFAKRLRDCAQTLLPRPVVLQASV